MVQVKQKGKAVTVSHFGTNQVDEGISNGNMCCRGETLVGARLRSIRRGSGLSIRALAEKSGISMNTLSLIENSRTSPSVHTLGLLADGLGIPLITLFEEEKLEQEIVYQREGQRENIPFAHGTLEKLSQGLSPLGAEPILVNLKDDQEKDVSHEGREFIYCVAGQVICHVSGKDYHLLPGDSLLFDATMPHRWINSQHEPSRILVLFCLMEAREAPALHHLEY